MNMIKCPFCGVESPAFDYAHVCLTGPNALKIKGEWSEVKYIPETPEEEEAWKELEARMQEMANKSADDLAKHIDDLAARKK